MRWPGPCCPRDNLLYCVVPVNVFITRNFKLVKNISNNRSIYVLQFRQVLSGPCRCLQNFALILYQPTFWFTRKEICKSFVSCNNSRYNSTRSVTFPDHIKSGWPACFTSKLGRSVLRPRSTSKLLNTSYRFTKHCRKTIRFLILVILPWMSAIKCFTVMLTTCAKHLSWECPWWRCDSMEYVA